MSSKDSKDPEKFSGESSSDDDDDDALSSEMIRQMLQLRLGAGSDGSKKEKPKVCFETRYLSISVPFQSICVYLSLVKRVILNALLRLKFS